ncbi:DUF2380 domain-containing protein [Myxococcaceae bacterium GXIMD 01537]
MRFSLLLAASIALTTGCASRTQPPGWGRNLGHMLPATDAPGERPRALDSPPPSVPKKPQRLHRRQELREAVTRVSPGNVAPSAGSAAPGDVAPAGLLSAAQTHQAVLAATREVKNAAGAMVGTLSKLAARPPGLGNRGLSGVNGAFTRYLDHGSNQLTWLHGALGSVSTLTDAASDVADPHMELALLRMSGPGLQAAMSGALLLAAWVDFLHLADVVLRECPAYSVETLFVDMHRVQGLVEPSMKALASADPERVEAAATALPELMGQLTREFQSIREGARVAMDRADQTIAVAQLVEMLTLASAMKVALPRLPPAAPATLGVSLVVGSSGVMMGSQVVVSAEWVELMRRLVRAGVLSASSVSAAVRIHAGGMMMAQANQDLPQGVREALGDGPEVRALRETGRAGAGMGEPPRHHVLPREFREWFEKRGFTGDMNIDQFCVRMERASHEAIHGGGDWRLGRLWPKEWNRMIMKTLYDAEVNAGRRLTRNEILDLVAEAMKEYKLPMNFIPGRGR